MWILCCKSLLRSLRIDDVDCQHCPVEDITLNDLWPIKVANPRVYSVWSADGFMEGRGLIDCRRVLYLDYSNRLFN